MPKETIKGPLLMFMAAALFSVMAVLVKIISSTIPSAEIAFFRSFISVLIIVGMVALGHVKFRMVAKDKLVFRGILGGISLLLYFYAIDLTKLSNAVLLTYSYPIFATIFSAMYLHEKLNRQKILLIICALVGMFLVLDFDPSTLNLGDVLALLSGVTGGMAIVSIRELRKTDSSPMIVFSFVLTGAIFSLFFMKGNTVLPAQGEFLILLIIGTLGAIGQLMMTYAYKLCSVALGGVISISNVVMTAILSVIIFKEVLTVNVLIGGVLIFLSAAFFSREEHHEAAK